MNQFLSDWNVRSDALAFHAPDPSFNQEKSDCVTECQFANVCRDRFGSQSWGGFPPVGENGQVCRRSLEVCQKTCESTKRERTEWVPSTTSWL